MAVEDDVDSPDVDCCSNDPITAPVPSSNSVSVFNNAYSLGSACFWLALQEEEHLTKRPTENSNRHG